MFDQKRVVFVTADVGHHGEILTKLIHSWFNESNDDVRIQDNHLKFTKISMTSYGKMFLYSMLFEHNNLGELLSKSLSIRKKNLESMPDPKPGDPPAYMNSSWPVATTIHLREEFDMVNQINEVPSEILCTFTPYNWIGQKELEYINERNKFYTGIYDPDEIILDSIQDTMYHVSEYKVINNRYDISIISDIVNGTTNTIDELYEIFQRPSVTSEDRLRTWMNLAHNVYKKHYER